MTLAGRPAANAQHPTPNANGGVARDIAYCPGIAFCAGELPDWDSLRRASDFF